jgi:NAD+ synthase (glutamine-hydrolysing)
MKIALAQMKVVPMQIETNLCKMREFIEEAKNKECDLIAFPELCISGYLCSDRFTEDDFIEYLALQNETVNAWADQYNTTIIWGNIEIDKLKNGRDGRFRRYNSIIVSDHGRMQSRHKQYLATYRMFDDQRYFSIDSDDGKYEPIKSILLPHYNKVIGLSVCEELWNSDKKDYGSMDITEEFFKQNPEFIINISASPFSVNKGLARDKRIKKSYTTIDEYQTLNKLYKKACPFLYVNCVGTQNNGKSLITFDGDSRAYDMKGNKIPIGLDPYEEGLLYFESQTYGDVKPVTSISRTLLNGDLIYEDQKVIKLKTPIEQKKDAIIQSFKDIDEWCGYHPNKMIIGMSGGIDSSLSVCLAVEALGKDRVIGINLPSKYNSTTTKNIARHLAESLGIEYKELPIISVIEHTRDLIPEAINNIHEENLHARIRGLVLQSFAGTRNGIVVCNSNKIEVFAGYSTYGSADDIGAFAPLADLLKTEIFEMAKFYPYFPQELIPDENMNFSFAPSAELRDNQKDPFCWGLDDKIVDLICNYHRSSRQDIIDLYDKGILIDKTIIEKYFIVKENFIEHLDWLLRLYRKNVFKRNQYPPIVVTSKSSFGGDFRETLSN